ncbi:MAG TPA: glycosyltransferase family 39 protein, partial [Planctomycetaceae bacterium]|nr:glycosyltransferase family 39 protein [Planctomycetaceae bacterium]
MRLNAPQRPLLWIMLGALALRMGAALLLQHDLDFNKKRPFLITGDAEGYWELGREIARGEPYQLYDPPRRVERMPGYPVFVAGAIRLSQVLGLAEGRQYFVARLLMALVGTANCALVALLGRELFDSRTGNSAAAIVAVAPPLIGFSAILLSETLFATGLLVSLWCMARLVRDSGAGSGIGRLLALAALTGLTIAIAVYVRPSWLLAAPIFAGIFAVSQVRRRSFVKGLLPAAVVVLVAYGALFPWAYRNHRVTRHWISTTLWVGASLYDGFNPGATGDSNLKFVDEDRLFDRMSEYEVDQHYRAKAIEYIREHPDRAAWLTLEKLKRFWMPWPNAKQFDGLFPKVAVAVYFIPILLAAVIGWLTGPRNFWAWTLTLGPILYFCALHAIFLGSLRYRLPA